MELNAWELLPVKRLCGEQVSEGMFKPFSWFNKMQLFVSENTSTSRLSE